MPSRSGCTNERATSTCGEGLRECRWSALSGTQIISDLSIPNNSTGTLAGFSLSEMDPEWTSTAAVWASYLAATGLP